MARRRDHVIALRLNDREYRHLCRQVEISGLPREEYLRSLVMGKKFIRAPARTTRNWCAR